MDGLRHFKEELQRVYGRNDYWLVPAFRSVFSMLLFFLLCRFFSIDGKMANPMVILLFSLLSFFLPFSVLPCLIGVYLLSFFYLQSLFLLGIALTFFIFVFLLQSSVRGKDAILLAAMPLCFFLGIPYFLPLLVGLTMGLPALLSLGLGVMVYYFLKFIKEYKEQLSQSGDFLEQLEGFSEKILPFVKNKELLIVLLVFCLAALTVYIIRNFSFNYAWETALISGLVLEALLFFIYRLFSFKLNMGESLVSYLLSAVLAVLVLFFFRDADYRGTEFVQFEDDGYYYYVKAIPKKRAERNKENRVSF